MSVNVWNMLDGRRVVLASASPRRRELMKLLTDDFEIMPADIDESAEGCGAFEAAEMIARRKCMCIAKKLDSDAIVIGCDTVVISPEGELMCKPRDEADALRMLKSLQGAQSWVCSGVCVSFAGKVESFTEKTAVTFYPADNEQLRAYIATGEPMDKAGAYGIQGLGGLLIEKIAGDYNNVVGLPMARLARTIAELLEV